MVAIVVVAVTVISLNERGQEDFRGTVALKMRTVAFHHCNATLQGLLGHGHLAGKCGKRNKYQSVSHRRQQMMR